MTRRAPAERLKFTRLFMVLSSMSPLFILWAIHGSRLIPDRYFLAFCAFMVVVPYACLWWRYHIVKKRDDKREIAVGAAEDNRDHILVYLFAILLPVYSGSLSTWRTIGATAIALAFIVFLFWHLNLHYMNIVFAIRGYRVFTVRSPDTGNAYSGRTSIVVITKRPALSPGERIVAYRMSDTVYLESA